jgi:capsular polysaccharide biosynthesis protein
MSNNYYVKTQDCIEESTLDKRVIHPFYKEFYNQETIYFPNPKGINPPPWTPAFRFEKPFVAIINNGSVWAVTMDMVFIMTPNDKLLRDTVHYALWDIFNPRLSPLPTYYDETIAVLAWAGAQNYYHWLHDILTRFHLLELSKIPIDKYVLPRLELPFQFETLAKLKIPKTKIIEIDRRNFHLKAKNLVITSIPTNLGASVRWACDFIRKTFSTTDLVKKKNDYERIYISREDSSWRHVINEREVMTALSAYGFKKVVLTSLSVKEQIEIFSSAKIIISTYGASLTNLIFCEPGTTVIQLFAPPSIELFSNNNFMSEYFRISHYVGLNFYFMNCQATPSSSGNTLLSNIYVEIRELVKLIENLH